MRKFFKRNFLVVAFMATGMMVMAQHVTPVTISIVNLPIDSLRTLYHSEPTMYRASLDVLAQQLEQNATDMEKANDELKAERAHAKELQKSLEQATKMAASLKKLYVKEEEELKDMQKVVEQQQRKINKQNDLNQESREGYTQFLGMQQKELGASVRDVADRQHAISNMETGIQNMKTRILTYNQEINQKAAQLAQLAAQYKAQTTRLKKEQKSAKTMQ